MGTKWQPGAAPGRPRRRTELTIRVRDDVWQSYFGADYVPNPGELGDGVVDTLRVLTEFYKFVNWSKSQIGLDEKI